MEETPFFKKEKMDIKIRNFKKEDLDDLFEYASDENVGPNAGWPAHKNIDETKKILDTFLKDKNIYAIIYNNKVIGSISAKILENEKYLEIGYVLSSKYWGQGIMIRAYKIFEKMYENTYLCIITDKTNGRSQKIARKANFKLIAQTKDKYIFFKDNHAKD